MCLTSQPSVAENSCEFQGLCSSSLATSSGSERGHVNRPKRHRMVFQSHNRLSTDVVCLILALFSRFCFRTLFRSIMWYMVPALFFFSHSDMLYTRSTAMFGHLFFRVVLFMSVLCIKMSEPKVTHFEVSTGPPTRFTVFGERCTGTNFVQSLLQRVFGVNLTFAFGFKHFFGHRQAPLRGIESNESSDDTLFIAMVRHPVQWMGT
jgi:hypothetical protein